MRARFTPLLLGVGIATLAACGGGGGGGDVAPAGPTSSTPPSSNPPASPPQPPPPPPPPPAAVSGSTVGNVSKATSGGLPSGLRNAAERRAFPHYIGSLKDLTGRHPKQLPIRTYFASCDVETVLPRMFVSMTLEDTGVNADPDIPTIGSVFETVYDPALKSMRRTGNETIIPMCQETHGITASSDCSKIAVLCNTDFEAPASESLSYTKDLVDTYPYSSIDQPNNEAAVNARLSDPADRQNAYKYNGEMWLLEWDGISLASEPDRYVIHKAVGGQQLGATTLAYSEQQDVYGAAFTTNTFDNGGGRHKSGALMIIDRDGWVLNPDDPSNNDRERGWTWGCGGGHVLHMRVFHNPFTGHFGTLCTTDGAKYWRARNKGAIAVKMETSSTIFEGYENFIVASHNSAITNGGGHKVLPIEADRSIVALVGTDLIPADDPDYLAFIQAEADLAIERGRPERGIEACDWAWGEPCERVYMEEWYYNNGRVGYPAFRGGFWGGDYSEHELTKIGIQHIGANGRNEIDGVFQRVKWVVEDEDCMLGAPQLTDLKNGRFLLGWAKFQCLSDGTNLRRFAGAHTLHPKAYYVMEIDADGNRLTDPTRIDATGWGGMDEMVFLGDGKVGWAYIPNPEIEPDGSFTDPYQSDWEFMVYQSSSN